MYVSMLLSPFVPPSLSLSCVYKSVLNVCAAISSIQFSSVTQSCPTLCDPMNRSTPGLPVHHHLPEFTQTHVHWVHDAIQPSISSSVIPFSSCPKSLPTSESLPLSWLFKSGGQSIGALASASVNIPTPNDYSGLISFRIHWFELALQETFRSLLQHHSSKASILWHSAFLMVHLSHPVHDYWKNHSFD